MNKKKYNIKSILLTVFLFFILSIVIYSFIGILISGSAIKERKDQEEIVEKIENKNDKITKVTRHVFKYVTYTAETPKQYIFYDINGKRIAVRSKKDAKIGEVESIISKQYPHLKGIEIKIGYGKKNPAYIIEKEQTLLILDYINLKEVFYMKGES